MLQVDPFSQLLSHNNRGKLIVSNTLVMSFLFMMAEGGHFIINVFPSYPLSTLQCKCTVPYNQGQHGAKDNETLAFCVSPDSIDQLLVTLCEVAAKWILFAGQLGIPNARINLINRDTPISENHSIECLRAALLFWTASSVEPTYEKLIAALESPVINEEFLAGNVREIAEKLEGDDM